MQFNYLNTKPKQNNNQRGVFAALRERLDSLPNSRCAFASECIQSVKPGLRNVFMDVKLKFVSLLKTKQNNLKITTKILTFRTQAKNYQKDAIRGDYKKTGKCNLQIAKELYRQTVSSFAL
jgi:hypothetical protein